MKKLNRTLLCSMILAVLATAAALADSEYVANVISGATLERTEAGVYTVSYTGVTENTEYLILVVETSMTELAGLSENSSKIQFIDQKNSEDSTTISFTIRPRTVNACNVYLCGEGFENPLKLGEIVSQSDNGPVVRVGDVNGDDKVNAKDVMLLARYVSKWPGIVLNTEAADINADGKINAKDVMYMARCVAKWPGYTLP